MTEHCDITIQYRNFIIHISDQSWHGTIFCQVNQILGVNDENTGNCQSENVCTFAHSLQADHIYEELFSLSKTIIQSTLWVTWQPHECLHFQSFHQTVHFTITMADSARSIKTHHNNERTKQLACFQCTKLLVHFSLSVITPWCNY